MSEGEGRGLERSLGKKLGGMNKRQKKKIMKTAGRMPRWVTDYAAHKGKKPRIKGTFGPASEVRNIDPSEYRGDGVAPVIR